MNNNSNRLDKMSMNIISKLQSCSHGGIYSIDNNLRVKLDFSSNINPLGISKKVLKVITSNIKKLSVAYPDPNCTALREAIVKYIRHGLTPDWIMVGNGATELIHNFARSVSLKNSIIPIPTFCEYELAAIRVRSKIWLTPPSKKFEVDCDSIINKARETRTSTIFLCNPNNPAGTLMSTDDIRNIMSRIDNSKIILLIDESFIELLDHDSSSSDNTKHSMISKLTEFDNLVILRSMTKSFGLAGLRLGYLVANPKLIQKIKTNQIAWNVNGIAQLAGITALEDWKHITDAKKLIQKEKKYMYRVINDEVRHIEALPSNTNFFLMKLKNIKSTEYRDLILRYYGILVRDCASFTGMSNNFIRVSIRKHNENLHLLSAIKNMDTNSLRNLKRNITDIAITK